jgi:SAM-dependent methyltransferase
MQQRLKSAIKRILRPYFRTMNSRAAGLAYEQGFWDRYLRTGGDRWREDFRSRLDPNTPLADYHRRFVDEIPGDEVRILDVGAGPLTLLGKTHPTKRLSITAVDVLAPEYDRLLARHGITPPVRTIYAAAEDLPSCFAPDSFDLVNAQNCVDHMENPLAAIEGMLTVVRPGGWVVMDHAENEAEREGYRGLHQWNFTVSDGEFLIRGRPGVTNVTRHLAPRAAVLSYVTDGWVQVHIRKASSEGTS